MERIITGKYASFGIMLLSSTIVCVFLFYAHRSGLILTQGSMTGVIIIGVSVGVVIGLSHAIWMSRYQVELKRLTVHIDSMASSGLAPALPGMFMGLEDVSKAINRLGMKYHDRIEVLTAKRRELELHLKLAEAERQHALAILDAIEDAVVVTDSFNEVALANATAARVLDFELDEALHRPIDRVVREKKLVDMIKDTREASYKKHAKHSEYCLENSNSKVIYDVTLTNMQQDENPRSYQAVEGVVTVLRDVTKEKQIAEMKSDFVSNVSHELKTPLSSIKAYMEMLIDGEAGDEETRAEFYNIIQGETNRLQRLIDNILNISRIESGVVKVQREYVNVGQIVHEIMDVMQPQARAKNITLVEESVPMIHHIFADRDMLWQATLNLVGNAIKYTLSGGTVQVSVEADENTRMLNVFVKDTGIGIPQEALTHVFNKFYRVIGHKKIAKGTGLGLNLVKHIIETVHSGKVQVQSEVNVGSVFMYTLPMAENIM
ncbi:MAG: PAS domain-containing protein [Phycisphaeraceae bacterium]|nr:PAS domain-containing protein [Phycisphaeraceae bacterium]